MHTKILKITFINKSCCATGWIDKQTDGQNNVYVYIYSDIQRYADKQLIRKLFHECDQQLNIQLMLPNFV